MRPAFTKLLIVLLSVTIIGCGQSTSSTKKRNQNGVPDWYTSNYSIGKLNTWQSVNKSKRRSFCLDCVAKLSGTINIELADDFEREITDCSKVERVGNQDVRELVATMWALHEKGGNITSMDDLLADLVRLGGR